MPKLDITTGLKECSRCHIALLSTAFGKDSYTPDGLKTWCKVCNAAYQRQYYRERGMVEYHQAYRHTYPERSRKAQLKYYYANRRRLLATNQKHAQRWRRRHPGRILRSNQERRARSYGSRDGTLTMEARQHLYNSWTGICPRCHRQAVPTLDHIIPLSKGGKHSLTNVQLLCRACNSSKGAK